MTNGDGIDSNGTINLIGGTLEVYTPSQGDGDPLDAERGTYFKGATVLAVGHLGIAQGYSATTPFVTFGSAGGMGGQTNLVTAGSTIRITDVSGNELYSAKAVRNASYILFASSELTTGSFYTLKNGGTTAATSTAGTASNGGMGMGGQMPGNMGGNQGRMPGSNQGMTPGNNGGGQTQQPGNGSGNQGQVPGNNQQQLPGMNERQDMSQGGRQNGGFRNENPENNGEMPELPDGEFPPQMQENENGEADPQTPGNGERPERPAKSGEASVTAEEQEATAEPAQSANWFMSIIYAIRDFLRSLFG